MNQKLALAATALTLAVIAVVGFVDSVIDDRAGPAVLFAILAVGIVVMARVRSGETTVSMRRDLASWLDRVSPVTGETADEMSDRAVSRLRAGFTNLGEDE
jgi:hypothetical protein